MHLQSSDDHGSVFLSVFCKEYEYDPFTSGGQTGVVCDEYHICVCIYGRSADPDLYYHGVRLHWCTYHQYPVHFILVWCRSRNDVFALALGAFVAMFTGQLMAFPVYYVVVNYLYVGCWYLINMVIESVCFGVSNNWNPGKSCILSPIYYLTNNLRIQSVENSEYVTVGIEFKGAYLLGIYAVAGVVFLITTYQLYKWRKLETAGDLISMRGIKPVFRWGVAVCAGLLGGTAVADTIGNSFSSAKVHFWILAKQAP